MIHKQQLNPLIVSLTLTTLSALQLLGLKGRESYLEPQILAAFEDLASTQVEEGYTTRVQDGKLRLLHQAVDEVRNSKVSAVDSEVQVQWDDLPGALALLQEVRSSLCQKVVLLMDAL